MKFEVVFVHLLNDFSGSPKILKEVIRVVATGGAQTKLYLGSSGNGVLSTCGIPITCYGYHRTGYRLLTLFTYFCSQVLLFFKLLNDRSITPQTIIYVNTLLPFAAALYGKLTGRKVIYHIHEIAITPAPLKVLLTGIAQWTSCLNLYVSDAHQQALPVAGTPARRIHNALDAEFNRTAAASVYAHRRDGVFNVLMIAYLRDYKGIPEFMALVAALVDHPEIRFDLVVNDDPAVVDRYFAGKALPPNLTVHPRTRDTSAFYRRACLLLNLSRVDQCVETFGMTILEAMAFGIPVIVPPVGGPVELVTDGLEGFQVDSRNLSLLRNRVVQLCQDESKCMAMSQAGRARAAEFSFTRFAESITMALEQVRNVEN